MESFKDSRKLEGVLKRLSPPRLNSLCLPDKAGKLRATSLANFENLVVLLVYLQYYRHALKQLI